MPTKTDEHWKLFKPSACSVTLKGAGQAAVIDELVKNFVSSKCLTVDLAGAATKALVEREELASTGIGRRVAIPHVQLKGIDRAIVSLSVHPTGVDWKSLDGVPVNVLFTVLRPSKAGDAFDPERHLALMGWVAEIVRGRDFCPFALAVTNRTELVSLLKELSGRS